MFKNKKKEQLLDDEEKIIQTVKEFTSKQRRELNKETLNYLKSSNTFHASLVERAERSEKRAWRFSYASMVITLMAVGAVCGLTPLKELIPYTIRVNNNTGFTDIVYPKEYGGNQTMEQIDDQYWLALYVRAREGYNWYSVKSMYGFVQLTSTADVFASYKNMMTSDKSPVKLLKNKGEIDIVASPPVFINGTAQVRFTKRILSSEGKESNDIKPTHWIALISYDYAMPIKTKEQQQINPHGFRVLSYTKEQELNGAQDAIVAK